MIKGQINPSDGDPWDVIVPGIKSPLKKVKVSKIVGMVPLSSGNHKLIGLPKGHKAIDKDQVKEFVKRRQEQMVWDMSKHKVGNPIYF